MNIREGREVRRAAVIRDEDIREAIKHHHLPKRGFSRHRKTAPVSDAAHERLDGRGLLRRAGAGDAERVETSQQPLRELDVAVRIPAAQRDEIARVCVEEHERALTRRRAVQPEQFGHRLDFPRHGSKSRQRVFAIRRRAVEAREFTRRHVERIHQRCKRLARVKVRIVADAVGHQIPAIRPLAEIRMEAHPRRGPAEKGKRGGGAGEKLEVDRSEAADAAQSHERTHRVAHQRQDAIRADRQHIPRRDQAEHIDDESVVLEHDDEDMLAPDPLRRLLQREVSEHGGPLLGEFDEEDRFDRRAIRRLHPAEEPLDAGQGETHRHSDPAVDFRQRPDIHRRWKCPVKAIASVAKAVFGLLGEGIAGQCPFAGDCRMLNRDSAAFFSFGRVVPVR